MKLRKISGSTGPSNPDVSLPSEADILQFEKRCEARPTCRAIGAGRQSQARAGSVLGHVTKRIAAITPPRTLVVLRFLLNNPQEAVYFCTDFTSL